MASKTSSLSIDLEKISSLSSTVRTNWFKNVTVETEKWFKRTRDFWSGTGCKCAAFSSNFTLEVGESIVLSLFFFFFFLSEV